MKRSISLTISMLFVMVLVTAQTTVNLPPVQDNSIYSGFTSNSNGIGPSLFSGTPGSGNPNRALLQFDIAANVPATATITNVVLTLNCEARGGASTAENHSIHVVTTPWGEGPSLGGGAGGGSGVPAISPDATWLFAVFGVTPWATAGGDFNPVPSSTSLIGAPGAYFWTAGSLTADVQSWLNNPASNAGWLLKIDVEGVSGTSSRWTSREGSSTLIPNLAVTYTDTLSNLDDELGTVKIFPNPTNGFINVYGGLNTMLEKIKVLNLLGQVLIEQPVEQVNLMTIDLSALKAGTYLLEINSDSGSRIKRIVKK